MVHVIEKHHVGIFRIFLEWNRVAVGHIDAALVHLAHAWGNGNSTRVNKKSDCSRDESKLQKWSAPRRAECQQHASWCPWQCGNSDPPCAAALAGARPPAYTEQSKRRGQLDRTQNARTMGTTGFEAGNVHWQRPINRNQTSVGIELALTEAGCAADEDCVDVAAIGGRWNARGKSIEVQWNNPMNRQNGSGDSRQFSLPGDRGVPLGTGAHHLMSRFSGRLHPPPSMVSRTLFLLIISLAMWAEPALSIQPGFLHLAGHSCPATFGNSTR